MTTIAHVLCTGPSLARTFRRLGTGPIIGVNRAVDHTAIDWLVAGDAITYQRIKGLPVHGVCSFNAVLRDVLPPTWSKLARVAWEDLPHGPVQAQWGIEAACLLARHLTPPGEHLDILIFGCDRDANRAADWDGTPPVDDRSADRFAREADDMARTVAHLESTTRTRVSRILPP